jgi:hypothetical protein
MATTNPQTSPVAGTTTAPDARLGLGALVATYPAKRLSAGMQLVFWAMIVLSFGLLITAPFGIWFLVRLLRTPNFSAKAGAKRVDLHQHGVVLVEIQGPVAVFRFDAMSLMQQIVQRRVNGIKTGTSYLFTLTDAEGQSHKVTQFYDRIAELGQAMQTGVVQAQLEGVMNAVRAGQEVPFGPFALRQDGIATPKGLVDWDRLTKVTVQLGQVGVYVEGKRTSFASRPADQIPNLYCFLEAIGRLGPSQVIG